MKAKKEFCPTLVVIPLDLKTFLILIDIRQLIVLLSGSTDRRITSPFLNTAFLWFTCKANALCTLLQTPSDSLLTLTEISSPLRHLATSQYSCVCVVNILHFTAKVPFTLFSHLQPPPHPQNQLLKQTQSPFFGFYM